MRMYTNFFSCLHDEHGSKSEGKILTRHVGFGSWQAAITWNKAGELGLLYAYCLGTQHSWPVEQLGHY